MFEGAVQKKFALWWVFCSSQTTSGVSTCDEDLNRLEQIFGRYFMVESICTSAPRIGNADMPPSGI